MPNNVRLTEQAHQLLSEKAVDYKMSMKEIASEAILTLFKGKERNKELRLLLHTANKQIQDNKRFAFGAFLIGAVVSGCAVYFVVVLW